MRLVAPLAALLLLIPALALASGLPPPSGASEIALGAVAPEPARFVFWTGPGLNDTFASNDSAAPGGNVTLTIGMRVDDTPPNATRDFTIRVVAPGLPALVTDLDGHTLAPIANASAPRTSEVYDYVGTTIRVPANASGSVSFTLNVTLSEMNGTNVTVLGVGEATRTLTVGAVVAGPAPPTGLPSWAYYAGGAVVLVAAIAIGVSVRNRNVQKRMRGVTRSQALREAELEQIAEKKPERAEEIKQELRAQEQVREKRRELQILEAKRADVVKNMDLLKKRHETGGLSKLQFDNMMTKRQAELAKLDAEIAQMEAEDAAGGSAAA